MPRAAGSCCSIGDSCWRWSFSALESRCKKSKAKALRFTLCGRLSEGASGWPLWTRPLCRSSSGWPFTPSASCGNSCSTSELLVTGSSAVWLLPPSREPWPTCARRSAAPWRARRSACRVPLWAVAARLLRIPGSLARWPAQRMCAESSTSRVWTEPAAFFAEPSACASSASPPLGRYAEAGTPRDQRSSGSAGGAMAPRSPRVGAGCRAGSRNYAE
mmetsp:Transcript_18731/g.52985  ORF Transcript_18731/g.52985 Transcript_18731/m.52985 type:complete len:217 (+) Transcript_18731:2683-3333(+)